MGARALFDTRARALVVDETGRVVGVRATLFDEGLVHPRPRKAVILAAGGFGMNAEMVAHYVPALAPADLCPGRAER